jgi:phosphoenolpyruvate synthase/pyruvate phosphate dikinase
MSGWHFVRDAGRQSLDGVLPRVGAGWRWRNLHPAWTPLFVRIPGLITDLGRSLARGSIVARKIGIPVVMGIGNVTQKIRSGQVVAILGSEGKVC